MQTQGNIVPVSNVKGINVGRIEKELAAMWSGEAGGGEAAGVTRACALNLVVYTTAQEDRARIDEMLDLVAEQHPGRVLLLAVDREAAEPRLEAHVSTRCRVLGPSRKQICGEQVTIEAAGQAVETAATAVVPLLVPDVPVFVWWKDIPHFEDQLFDRMAAVADRVVIDSAAFDHPHEDMLRLAAMIRERQDEIRVSDLNWGRLTSWRTLLASFWDVADYRTELDQIDSVVVEYNSPDLAPDEIAPKALLITGWLASRLGWELKSPGARKEFDVTHVALNASGRLIGVRLQALEDAKVGDGMLGSVTLSSADGRAEFSVALKDEGAKLETSARIEGGHSVSRVMAYEAKSEGQRLSRELGFMAKDQIYEAALKVAARIIEAIKR